jgi:Flp pilus assembly protein TadG
MNTDLLFSRRNRTLIHHQSGQSMVEFALILPIFVLFIVGIFELGRAFFSYIAITNAAREGARVVTFWPGKTTILNVRTAVDTEIGSSPMVDVNKIDSIMIECGNPYTIVTTDAGLNTCPSEQPIRVTVTYQFDLILKLLFPQPLMLKRSAEMMVP